MSIKTCSIAASSYILFKELRGFSSKNSAKFALSASVLTLLLEKIRPKSNATNNWFEYRKIDLEHNQQNVIEKDKTALTLSKVRIIIRILNVANIFYFVFYKSPQEELISYISENKLKWIPMTTLIAPIIEEILFRGFLQEWMEVGCDLIDRHIYAISKESQHHISNVAQAVLFGAMHMISENKTENALIFVSTGLLGVRQGLWKRLEEGSLFTPIKLHTIQNTVGMFITVCLPQVANFLRKSISEKVKTGNLKTN